MGETKTNIKTEKSTNSKTSRGTFGNNSIPPRTNPVPLPAVPPITK